ncbi:HAD family hydrolase [Halostagnicola sp. A-GB9-2]|uniref:HAD family hydrolase n=1 Tax=Halostagnicola sp. A-GB9-2 TaxID=3048066 RepID=UPI0024BF5F2B|nr:HAD family hydrolase [Halostagnicola sp. A-GB9-2]MDJ1431742.1 HAD family hydrolase [Halostagnicola sp. A-GB9-2]
MSDAIETVCFDLDDTLCTYTQRSEDVLEAAFARAGVEPLFPIGAYHDRYRNYLEESDGIGALRRACFADLAADSGRDPETGRAVADAFASIRDQTSVDLLPGASAAVEALEAEYRLGLITNGAPGMQRAKLEAIGLEDAFETVVYAGHETRAKPDPEPFEVALEALEADPERSAYVGNSLESDVGGARAAGMRAVWVPTDGASRTTSEPEPTPDYVLESLEELRTTLR